MPPNYHVPKIAVMRHINCLSNALGTFYALYSLYKYILYAYILGEHFGLGTLKSLYFGFCATNSGAKNNIKPCN